MAKRRKTGMLQQKDFDMIKTMLDSGVRPSKIADFTGRSPNTIGAINKSSSMDEYHEIMKAAYLKYKKPLAKRDGSSETKVITQPEQAVDNSSPLYNELKKNNELIIRLTESLDDLVKILKPGVSQPAKKWPW